MMHRVCAFLLSLAAVAMAAPQPGDRVDLALFGHIDKGVEWDEPREFHEVRATAGSAVEYWVSSWPPPEGRGGWTLTDSPWNGEWKTIRAERSMEGGQVVFRFLPLTAEENANAKHRAGWAPRFRRSLKVRVTGGAVTAVYGPSRWNRREVNVRAGSAVESSIYNGIIESSAKTADGLRLRVLYTEHEPESNDRTIVSLKTAGIGFGVAMDDLIAEKGIYVRDADVFVGDGAAGATLDSFLASGRMRLGIDIKSLVAKQPEQSLEAATAHMPALNMTNRNPYRHIPLSVPGNRYKFSLLFNGNVWIGKRDSKLFADELTALKWEGNSIYYKIGTGAVPDFREVEGSARQRVLEDALPIAVTEWTGDGIEYRQEAFATLAGAPIDPLRNRGDEPAVLMTRITATNRAAEARPGVVWFYVDPAEKLTLRDGVLLGSGERPRAWLRPARGAFTVTALPAEARYKGDAARWEGRAGAG